MVDRKIRDKQLRETDILNAAEHIFATKGYQKTTIADIANEAQYAVGTIYLYFKDKQTLYVTLIKEKLQNLIYTVKERISQVKDVREKINILVEEELSYFEKNADFFRIYLSERSGFRWTIKDKISRFVIEGLIKYIDFIAELIKEAQREGIIKKEFDSKKVAFILASMINATVFPWLHNQSLEKEKLTDLSRFVLEVFYEGVGRND